MATNRINLNTHQYVRINNGYGQLIIEALAGDIHIVINELQPAIGNDAYHKLTDRQRLTLDKLDTNVWALGKNEGSRAVVTEFPAVQGAMGTSDLIVDAWGRQKVVNDYSLFHGVWTYDVPNRLWEEWSFTSGTYTPLAQTGTLVTSEDNMLCVSSGIVAGNGAQVRSKRNPRYQPNRGHLYSSSMIIPNAIGDGRRRFGLFCGCETFGNGVYFELEGDGSDWTLYAVRKSHGVIVLREAITTPTGYDPEKGHVYDIQYQWRGVGSYKFFINLEEVYVDAHLGTGTELSMRMPGLPAGFESVTDTTTELKMYCGCVDITSEGGLREGRQFASVSTGEDLLQADATGRAMLGIYIPRQITYDGDLVPNTRDLVASKLAAWTRDEAAVQVWAARDINVTNLRDNVTWSILPDSTSNFAIGGENDTTGSGLDAQFQLDRSNMQLVLNEWHDLEEKNVVINPDQDAAPFYITPGDILIIAVKSIGGNDLNATTLYLSEEL